MEYLTIEDVRDAVQDRVMEDNELVENMEDGLSFSDEEIQYAMKQAIRKWNRTPPLMNYIPVSAFTTLPGEDGLFLSGTLAYLYHAAMSRYMRNDMDYTAGGVNTTIVQKRIEHFKSLYKLHMDEFVEGIKNRKHFNNMRNYMFTI